MEAEPNNTCLTAQDLGSITLPFSVDGSLDTPPETPDVDFYKFTVSPGDLVIIDHKGSATGDGTLRDPLLGAFDSGCNQIGIDDNSGVGRNSRLAVTAPPDGMLILAASSFNDRDFSGDGGSADSYQLTLRPGGLIQGSLTHNREQNRFSSQFVAAFTPSGEFVARANFACCESPTPFELVVPVGTYRVVAQGNIARTWYQDQPTFNQADLVEVSPNAQITGIDLQVLEGVVVTPAVRGATFANGVFQPGDTLAVDLSIRNLSPNPADVTWVLYLLQPAEPEIDRSNFCCFEDRVSLIEEGNVVVPPAQDDSIQPDYFTLPIDDTYLSGIYNVCVRVLQRGWQTSLKCNRFSVVIPPRCQGQLSTIFGTNDNDVIEGTPGDDVISGLGGNDVISGLGGNDVICGDEEDDSLFGQDGDDSLDGGPGDDLCNGGPHLEGDVATPGCEFTIDIP